MAQLHLLCPTGHVQQVLHPVHSFEMSPTSLCAEWDKKKKKKRELDSNEKSKKFEKLRKEKESKGRRLWDTGQLRKHSGSGIFSEALQEREYKN